MLSWIMIGPMKTQRTSLLTALAMLASIHLAGSTGHADAPKLERHDPIECSTTTTMELSNVIIEAKDVAVKVTGDCAVSIKNSHIVGGKAALKVTSGGSISVVNTVVISKGEAVSITGVGAIDLKNSVVHGKKYAVRMTNRGSVSAENTRFFGKKKLHQLSSYAGDKKSKFSRWKAYKARKK